MCAIAGCLDLGSQVTDKTPLLRRMASVQAHRGPDGEGAFIENAIGLAHRRLSIIGGESGRQPLFNEDQSVVVVANGEFFDYIEQRKGLEARGHQFRTQSDCEILVHLWEESGEEMIHQLRGQFAFALWDRKKSILFVARDRVGIVPLHWAKRGQQFFFSSEVKGLLASEALPREADVRGIDHVFSFLGTPGERTCFRGIFSLLPGHSITIRQGMDQEITPRQYWDLDFPDQGEEYNPSAASVIEEFGDHLQRAVDLRMRADVPVGSYLSGGIDSSLVLNLARRARPDEAIPSFTIEIPTPELNELSAASEVARLARSPNHAITCGARVIGNEYPALVQACDAPVMDTSSAALNCLSRKVHGEGIKTVLTGEGADEALAGYSWFKLNRIISLLDRGERRPSNLIRRVIGKYQGRSIPWEEARGYQDHIGGPNATSDFFGLVRRGRQLLYSEEMWERIGSHCPYSDLKVDTKRMKRWHPLNQSLYFGYKTMLPGLLLNQKGDRPAMAHSVETRYPFLDENVVDFCARLHPRWKLRGFSRDKYLLRKFGSGFLPSSITQRRKHIFRAPFAMTFFSNPPEYVDQIFSEESLKRTGYFSVEAVRRLYLAYRGQSVIRSRNPVVEMAMTAAMATQLWHHLFLDHNLCELSIPSPPPVSQRSRNGVG